MNTSDHVCGQACRPSAVNALGVEVQTHSLPDGWTGVSKPYETYCQARTAMNAFPQDGTERRVYTALAPPKRK